MELETRLENIKGKAQQKITEAANYGDTETITWYNEKECGEAATVD